MSNAVKTLWKMMREKFGLENVDEDAFGEAYLYSQQEVATYELDENERGEKFILCKVCGLRSFHPKDIENKFCGNCHVR